MPYRRPVLVLALGLVVGCGGRVGEPVGATGDERGSSAPSSGSAGPTEPSAEPAELPPATRAGRVRVATLAYNVLLDASFWDEAPKATPTCYVKPIGEPGSFHGLSAGDVQISYVSTERGRLTKRLPWEAEHGYYSAQDSSGSIDHVRLDVAGESTDVTATGDVVPAFQASVTASDDVEVVGAVDRKEDGVVQRLDASAGADLVLAWTPSKNTFVELTLAGAKKFATCRFPASAPSGVVPMAIVREVAAVPSGRATCPPGATCLDAHLDAGNETKVKAGDFAIDVQHVSMRLLTIALRP